MVFRMANPLALTRLLGTPLILAPMAGGISTAELLIAASRGGALGFWPAGYRNPEQLADDLSGLRKAGATIGGVNLFVPPSDVEVGNEAVDAYAELLRPEADRHGVQLGSTGRTDDWFADKVAVLAAEPVPAVSFTFGLPPRSAMAVLRAAGSVLIATVTNPAEARAATEAGLDVLCVQAGIAGGHRATFGNYAGSTLPLSELLQAVREVSPLPLVAAGGISSAADLSAALRAGAVAAQVGTAFLAATESGTSAVHRSALTSPGARTAVTRAFTGRPARAIVNNFLVRYGDDAPAAYPAVHVLTAPLRRAGAAAGDASVLAMWAGTGHARARNDSAEQIAADLLSRA